MIKIKHIVFIGGLYSIGKSTVLEEAIAEENNLEYLRTGAIVSEIEKANSGFEFYSQKGRLKVEKKILEKILGIAEEKSYVILDTHYATFGNAERTFFVPSFHNESLDTIPIADITVHLVTIGCSYDEIVARRKKREGEAEIDSRKRPLDTKMIRLELECQRDYRRQMFTQFRQRGIPVKVYGVQNHHIDSAAEKLYSILSNILGLE